MRQCNLSVTNYDEILDDDLDQTVSEIIKEFPRCGEAMVRKIPRQRDVQHKDIILIHKSASISA